MNKEINYKEKYEEIKEKYNILNSTLITLHTLNWTGNNKKLIKLLELIGAYSYARTNSNMCDDGYEEINRQKTLENLKNPNLD